MGDEVSQMIRNLHNSREYDLPRSKIFLFSTPRPNELLCNCTGIIGRDGRELNPYWSRILPKRRSRAANRSANTQILQGSPGRLRGVVRQRHRRAGRRAPDPADQGRHDPEQRRRRGRRQEQEFIARRHGRSSCIPAKSHNSNGCSMIITTSPTRASCRSRAKASWWQAAVFRPSTRRWPRRGSPRNVFRTARHRHGGGDVAARRDSPRKLPVSDLRDALLKDGAVI